MPYCSSYVSNNFGVDILAQIELVQKLKNMLHCEERPIQQNKYYSTFKFFVLFLRLACLNIYQCVFHCNGKKFLNLYSLSSKTQQLVDNVYLKHPDATDI